MTKEKTDGMEANHQLFSQLQACNKPQVMSYPYREHNVTLGFETFG